MKKKRKVSLVYDDETKTGFIHGLTFTKKDTDIISPIVYVGGSPIYYPKKLFIDEKETP